MCCGIVDPVVKEYGKLDCSRVACEVKPSLKALKHGMDVSGSVVMALGLCVGF